MSKLELAGVVTVAYLALYGVCIAALRRRNAVNRRLAAALPPDLEVDPFHALAVPTGKPAAMDQAALAALLYDGLITVDAGGAMSVTARAGDPEHPVPAAWLECLHRAERPATVAELRDDPELRQRHASFLREQDGRLADWNKAADETIGCLIMLVTEALGCFYTALLALSLLDWVLGTSAWGQVIGTVILTAVVGPPAGLFLTVIAFFAYPDHLSPLGVHCEGLPPHPAVDALTDDQRQLLAAG